MNDISDAELKRFPVETVSWRDAQLFLKALNAQAKDEGWMYRLPKEAEWEYACRGGPLTDRFDSAFDFYLDKPTNQLLPNQANTRENGNVRTCKVGNYKPNRLGLYDMHGNVWEWCDNSVKTDGVPAVARGGGRFHDFATARAWIRHPHGEFDRYADFGLRVARIPVRTEGKGK